MILECASRAIRVYRRFPLQFAVIAALALPFSLFATYLLPSDTVLSTLVQLILALVASVVFAALIHASNDALNGSAPSFVRSYGWLLGHLRPVVETDLRHFGAAFILSITVIGIPWGIRIFIRWFFALYEVVASDKAPIEAISSSCELVAGRWWITAGRIIMPYFVITVPSIVITFLVPVVGSIVWSVIGTLIVTPIFVSYYTSLHREYRQAGPSQPTRAARR